MLIAYLIFLGLGLSLMALDGACQLAPSRLKTGRLGEWTRGAVIIGPLILVAYLLVLVAARTATLS